MAARDLNDADGNPDEEGPDARNERRYGGQCAEERRLGDAGDPVANSGKKPLHEAGEHGPEEDHAAHASELLQKGMRVPSLEGQHALGAGHDLAPVVKDEVGGQGHEEQREHPAEREPRNLRGDHGGARPERHGLALEATGDLRRVQMKEGQPAHRAFGEIVEGPAGRDLYAERSQKRHPTRHEERREGEDPTRNDHRRAQRARQGCRARLHASSSKAPVNGLQRKSEKGAQQ